MPERPHNDPPTDILTTLAEAEHVAALRRFEALRPHIQDGVALAAPSIGHIALNADRVYIFMHASQQPRHCQASRDRRLRADAHQGVTPQV